MTKLWQTQSVVVHPTVQMLVRRPFRMLPDVSEDNLLDRANLLGRAVREAHTCEGHQEDDAERGRGQKQCLLVFAFQMTLEDHTGNVVLRDQLLKW